MGAVTKVDITEKELTLYSQGTGWDVSGKIQVEKILPPLPILEKTTMRYRVNVNGQDAWLDKVDVIADTPVTISGECEPPRLTGKSSAATRGLGEPCNSPPPKNPISNLPKQVESVKSNKPVKMKKEKVKK